MINPTIKPIVAVPQTAFGLPECSISEVMAIAYKIDQIILYAPKTISKTRLMLLLGCNVIR